MSINRPNAPKHLPSDDLDHSYFRAWALRGSEGDTPGGALTGSSNPSTPSPISPTSLVAQRKARNAERRRVQSEILGPPTPALRGPRATPMIFGDLPPGIIIEDDPPAFLETPNSAQSLNSSESSNSRGSTRARTLVALPGLRIAFNATKDGRPPRQARSGHKWREENSGHWVEVQLGRPAWLGDRPELHSSAPQSSSETPMLASENDPVRSVDTTPVTPAYTDVTTIVASDNSSIRGNPFANESQSPRPAPGATKELLYCRTKRLLGLKKDHPRTRAALTRSGPYEGRTMTGELLERTTSALRSLLHAGNLEHRLQRGMTDTSASTGDLSIAGSRWPRLRANRSSDHTTRSSSFRSETTGSSIKQHVLTPEPEAMYIGSDHNRYLAVELTKPGAPAFLPSEARRIKTPPLASPGLGNKRPRGFFFDINSPTDGRTPGSMDMNVSSSGGTPGVMDSSSMFLTAKSDGMVPERQRRVSDTNWYRVEMHAIEQEEAYAREAFASAVPEHLPNSPMCPRNPKHKSKGTGHCIYHGSRV